MTTSNSASKNGIDIIPQLTTDLPIRATFQVEATFGVSPHGFEITKGGPARAWAFVKDCSGSMANSGKWEAANLAIEKGLSMLQPQDFFTLIVFAARGSDVNYDAKVVYPMSQATPANIKAAIVELQKVPADGGTRIGKGIELAYQELAKRPDLVPSLWVGTDGQNNSDNNTNLATQLARAQELAKSGKPVHGEFRGIGDDWDANQLTTCANAFGTNAKRVADAVAIQKDFQEMMQTAQAQTLTDVKLRIWTPGIVKVIALKRFVPDELDVFARLSLDADNRTQILSMGQLGNEPQEYYVQFEVTEKAGAPARKPGSEFGLAQLSVAYNYGGQSYVVPVDSANVLAPVKVMGKFTDQDRLTTVINPKVAQAKGQGEFSTLINAAVDQADSNPQQATIKLQRALEIAQAAPNQEVKQQMTEVIQRVGKIDTQAGTVVVKRNIDKGQANEAKLQSRTTQRVARQAPADATPAADPTKP